MNDSKIMIRTAHTDCELKVRQGEGEAPSRVITGRAILFGVPSVALYEDARETVYEVIDREAVTRDLLDSSDIKMTMFHDRQVILARSRQGKGTLSYEVDDQGVIFSFEAPHTSDGDKALELVRRGDISGCSFMFSTPYFDESCVERSTEKREGRKVTTCRVKKITGIHDFTLAADPAYPQTSCEVEGRELRSEEDPEPQRKDVSGYVSEMRENGKRKIKL